MEVKFEDVNYSYKKINYVEKEVLQNINLTIKEGQVNGIIGPSGSGKTTLLELMDALIFPTSGNIQVGQYQIDSNSKSTDFRDLHFRVGFLFQFPEEQIFNTTVKEELEFSLKYYHYKEKQLDERVLDALKMVDLGPEYLEKDPFSLSSGEKRKVALASVLILNPDVLILDEPTLGLDDISKRSLMKLLRMLKNRYHKTIVIVSHDTDFLHQIVNYVFVLYNHKIVLQGDKYDVFKQVKKLKQYGIHVPKVIEFSDKVLQKKGIKIGYRDDINDLIKDIYRYVK